MRIVNEFLSTLPFDLYELALFRLVVDHGSFTKAAEVAGLTQSAITRQIQGMESSLGITLLERTTRRVRATAAGAFLHRESARLLGDVEGSLKQLREDFAGARKEIRVAVSRTIGLAHLPGFFHANLRRMPEVGYTMAAKSSGEIISALEANEQDIGVICPPKRLPKTLRVTHRFQDAFTLITPANPNTEDDLPLKGKGRIDWLKRQNWLLIHENTNTGQQLRAWMRRQSWRVEPIMQLDNFDLIINLVALGMGVSLVPIRSLALYGQKRRLRRWPLPVRFERELVVMARKQRKMPDHLVRFIENVLF